MEDKEYEPFGDEWEKSMMQLSKKVLVDFYRRACKELKELRKEGE